MVLLRRGIHFGSYGRVDAGPAVFGRLAAAARAAEEAGFDAISVPDHVHQNQVAGGPASPMFEAYTVLGALAAHTRTARLLALVSPVTLRGPGLLAKAVTTLDVISGGRAVLGVGAGWDAAEHEAYGIPFPSAGERFDRLDEALQISRALFGPQQPATSTGTHYAIRDAYCCPRPVNGHIPILVAGGGERRTLDLVARYGDACNVFADLATARRKFGVLAAHCERAGRDPAEITKTVFAFDTSDLGRLSADARVLASAGADGMIVVGPNDTSLIPEIGEVLGDAFPG
jgi:F420-dependent oxidoreductase-like protein